MRYYLGDSLKEISQKEKISQTKGEYVYSLVAKEVGINMAQTYLVESHGATHFVTERFDINNSENSTERLHMHSLSGLLHHNPAETSFGYQNLFSIANRLNIPYLEAKYTILKDWSTQYDLQEWYKAIINKTDKVLRAS